MRYLSLALVLLGIACTPKPETPVETLSPTPTVSVETPSPSPVAIPIAPAPPKTELALLESFLPRVTFRRQNELAWEEAVANLPLFRFDAVKTHSKAGAKVTFLNGSVVDLTEETLLIINPGGAKDNDKPSFDRVLVRQGNLKAQTKKELWILTTAALFRMKPKKGNTTARGILAIKEGKKLSVELKEGDGLLLRTKAPGKIEDAKPVKLVINKPVLIAAPTVPAEFGTLEDELEWPAVEKMEEKAREVASLSPNTTKPNTPKPDFIITSPADYTEVKDASIELRGIVKGGEGSLQVNGKTISVNSKKEFRTKVHLNRGANAILIQWNVTDETPVFRRWTIIRR